jgi:hypothetical protein
VGGISPRVEGEEMPVGTYLEFIKVRIINCFLFVDVDGFSSGDRTNIEIPGVQKQLLADLKSLSFF